MPFNWEALMWSIIYFICGAVFLVIARYLYHWVHTYKVDEQLVLKDNFAAGTSIAGYYIGMIIIFCAALYEPPSGIIYDTKDYLNGLRDLTIYAALGMILLIVASFINDKLIQKDYKIAEEIVNKSNISVGLTSAGGYIASAMIIAGSIMGDSVSELGQALGTVFGGIVSALIFFVLGQFALIAYSYYYRKIAGYNVIEQIKSGSVAAGISICGNLAALGILLFIALRVDAVHFTTSLLEFGIFFGIGIILFPIIRMFVDRVFLSPSRLIEEIARDGNVNAGILELVLLIGMVSFLIFLV